MDFQQLKNRLAAEAKANGICKEWYNRILNAPSKEHLLMLFVKGLDFCLKNAFTEDLWAEFGGIRQHYGVFVNDPIDAKGVRNVIAFGTSEGKAEFDGFNVAQIWARDDTKINVKAGGHAYITVDIADRAKVEITASDMARICIFFHGGSYNANTAGSAQIKVIDKRN
jgi:hypothetical protein